MAHLTIRTGVIRTVAGAMVALILSCSIGVTVTSEAHADAVAYLVNVTVRPGYNFINPDHALEYGHEICQKVAAAHPYSQIIGDVKADLANSDEYQASYLITQAVNELCPALIWQLRNSAAHYRAPVAG